MTNTPSPDEDRELKLDIRMSLEALAANEATVDETFNDITAVVLSDRAKLEEALRGIQDRIEAAAGWINDATLWDERDSPDGVRTVTDYVLKDVRAALNRSTDRAT